MLLDYWDRLKKWRYTANFRRINSGKAVFECPVCGYVGPFEDISPETGLRIHAKCPSCGALERHRLQLLVLRTLLQDRDCLRMKLLHFAPEPVLKEFFSRRFGVYETADLDRVDVDFQVNLLTLPFGDDEYDFIFASHVLEHIAEDNKAIREIHRVLKPGGVAVLPVPVVSEQTIEYPEPNPKESFHVRAPGVDYFDRYKSIFSVVDLYSSDDLDQKHQLYIYEKRTDTVSGNSHEIADRHNDFVPVCYK